MKRTGAKILQFRPRTIAGPPTTSGGSNCRALRRPIRALGPEEWIFVLYAPPERRDGRRIVPFTIVNAPFDREDDRRHLLPYTNNGWKPIVESTDDVRMPIATLLCPGNPGQTFREALEFLLPEFRDAILAPDVTPEYVPFCRKLRSSS